MKKINNIREYAEEMAKEIRIRLPEAEIEVKEILKNNTTKVGIMVRPDKKDIAPVCHINNYFENQNTIAAAVEHFMVQYQAIEEPSFALNVIKTWNNVKDNVKACVINYEKNQELLKELPHAKFGDLAIYIVIDLSVMKDENERASIKVNDELLKLWEQDLKTVLEAALKNSDDVNATRMIDIIKEMFSEMDPLVLEDLISEPQNPPIYVMSNTAKFNGATALLYPDAFQKLANKFDSNLFILPSSVHEILAIPDDGEIQLAQLSDMVYEVNTAEVAPEEQLSDRVYYYNRTTNQIEFADTAEPLTIEMA